jgi:hypothetical protein
VGIISENIIAVTGFSATSALGALEETTADANAYPTGVNATGFVSSVLVWGNVIPGVTDNFNLIVTGQSTNWQEVA